MIGFVILIGILTIGQPSLCFGDDVKGEAGTAGPGVSTLLVVGVSKQFQDRKWDDNRVGFGIRQLITEELYATGKYRLIEEKPEMRARVEEFSRLMWATNADPEFEGRLADFEKAAEAEVVARGVVESFSVPRSDVSFGPLHRASETTVVKVRIILRDVRTGKEQGEMGQGESRRSATSVMFEFREDRVAFDKTAVGYATAKAVKAAVKSMKDKGLLP